MPALQKAALVLAISIGSFGGLLSGQQLSILYQFSNTSPVSLPQSTLIELTPGVFVASYVGGLFEITSGGAFSVFSSFANSNYDVAIPGALTPGSNGLLYGVRWTGEGPSEVYRIGPNGGRAVPVNSSLVYAGPLTEGADGNLWGTQGAVGNGYSVFKLSPGGTLESVYEGVAEVTEGPLLQASDGNFYGATAGYMTSANVIYRVTPAGVYNVLYTFPTGEESIGGLIQASNGLLYGTAAYVPAACNPNQVGEVFSISLNGVFRSIWQFRGDCYGGGLLGPGAALIEASDGKLYGSTSGQGIPGFGTVFSLSPEGTDFKDLVEFNDDEGSTPFTEGPALAQGSDGNLYGTTETGGTGGGGIIYKLDLGLAPPPPSVKLIQPSSGSPGTTIRLTGNHLLGLSAVNFNGTLATFTPVNANYAEAVVPAGAATGPITVTTMNGSFTTTTSFKVE
jgi:uncharacterized repeat protein (TIGR03803 family)